MSISRRKKGKRHHQHHKRRRLGGYISGNTDPGVGYNKTLQNQERERQKKEKPKFSLFSIPTWLDSKVNKNVVDQDEMKRVSAQYNAARNETQRSATLETLKDMLIVNDINKNPKDYLREWEKGKHRRNNWVKWLARAGLGAAGVAGAYGLYQYGVPYLSTLINTGSAGAKIASTVGAADMAAQEALPKDMSAAATSGNMTQVLKAVKKLGKDDPAAFAELYNVLGLNPNTLKGSGYRRRRKVKRRKHHHHKR